MALPQKLPLDMMTTAWAQQLDPVIKNQLNSCSILKQVSLVSGLNTINHLLGKPLQGYFIVRQRAAASIYDTQDTNQMPQLTLTLQSSAPVVIDLAVF